MWALTRLREFNRACHSADSWDRAEIAESLQFAEGLMLSCFLVMPFWLGVALVLLRLTK